MMQGRLDKEAEATRRAEQQSKAILQRLHESEEAAGSMHKRIGDLEAEVDHQRAGEAAADSMHKRIRELEAEVDHLRTVEAMETQLRNDLQSKLSQADAGLNEAVHRVAAAEAKQVQMQQAAKDSEARRVAAEIRLAAKTREERDRMMSQKASEERVARDLQESSLAVRASHELVQQGAASLQEANKQVLKLRQELIGQKERAQDAWRAAQEQERRMNAVAAGRMVAERRLADSLATLQGLELVATPSGTPHSDAVQLIGPVTPQASAQETLVPRSFPELTLPTAPLAPLPAPPLVDARAIKQEDAKRGGALQGLLNQLYILLTQLK